MNPAPASLSPGPSRVAVALACALALPAGAAAQPKVQGCPAEMRQYHPGRFPMAGGAGLGEVGDYCLDVAEVSAEDWTNCVRKGRCSDAGLYCSKAANYGVKERLNHPINCVSWAEADAYCKGQGKRLPTEAEWEWAARGALRGLRYPWGSQEPATRACWDGPGNSAGKGGRNGTCPVGATPLGDNPDGVHDLAGNVREWTSTQSGRLKVVRGGSWGDSLPEFLAAGFRGMNAADERFEITGFRCASELQAVPAAASAAAPARPGKPAPGATPVRAIAPPAEEPADDDGIVVAPEEDPAAPPPAPKPAPKKPAEDWKPANTIQVDGLDLKSGR